MILADTAVLAGRAIAAFAISKLRTHEDVPDIPLEVERELHSRYAILCYFWIDRSAYSMLPPERRARLMDLVVERFLDTLVETSDAIPSRRADARQVLQELLALEGHQWAEMPWAPSSKVPYQRTLLWAFSKEIAAAVGRRDDIEAMTTVLAPLPGSLRSLQVATTIEQVEWPEDN
jgi:hypothetical protein